MDSNIIRSWNNQTIRQREDGYLSATDMCQACGKLFADWFRLNSTTEYLQAFESDMGIPISGLVKIVKGGIPSEQGTWVHRRVAIRLAQWLSPKFAVQVDEWVEELLLTGKVDIGNNTDYVPANLEALQGIITGLLNNPASLTTDQLLRVIDQSIKVMHIMMQYHKIGMYETADCISQVSQIVKPPKEENQRLKVQTLSEVRKCGSVQTFEENFDARSVAETWMNTFKESEFPTNRKKINEPEVKVIDTIRSRSDEWLDTFVKPEFYDDKTFSKYVETHLTYTGSLIDSVWFEDFFKGAKKFGLLSSKLTPGQQAALLKGWMERYLKSSRKKLKVSDVFCNGYIRGFHRKF